MIHRNTVKYSTVTSSEITKRRHLDEYKKKPPLSPMYDRTLGIINVSGHNAQRKRSSDSIFKNN